MQKKKLLKQIRKIVIEELNKQKEIEVDYTRVKKMKRRAKGTKTIKTY